MKFRCAAFLLLCVSVLAHGQQDISGYVLDTKSGEALGYANAEYSADFKKSSTCDFLLSEDTQQPLRPLFKHLMKFMPKF